MLIGLCCNDISFLMFTVVCLISLMECTEIVDCGLKLIFEPHVLQACCVCLISFVGFTHNQKRSTSGVAHQSVLFANLLVSIFGSCSFAYASWVCIVWFPSYTKLLRTHY